MRGYGAKITKEKYLEVVMVPIAASVTTKTMVRRKNHRSQETTNNVSWITERNKLVSGKK